MILLSDKMINTEIIQTSLGKGERLATVEANLNYTCV